MFQATDNGSDRIKDFEDGKDVLDLTAFGFTVFDAIEAIASNTGSAHLKLDFGDGNQVVIENFTKDMLGTEDVLWNLA